MPRTPLFNRIRESLRQSLFVAENPGLESRFFEQLQAKRDRRTFLKQAGASALLASSMSPVAALARSGKDWLTGWDNADDVIILGGGLSGLTAAYRLSQSGIRCSIYEAAPRLGGRILTQDRFNAEGMFCELGGELIDTEQHEILELAADLGLAIDDFVPIDAKVERGDFFVGGRHYHTDQIVRAFAPLALQMKRDLAAALPTGGDEGPITYRRHNAASVRLDRMSLKEYLYSKTDIDRWLLDAINTAYLGEYGEETELQSALNLLILIQHDPSKGFRMFGSSDESKRIRGGNSRLIEALASTVGGSCPIRLGHELTRIEDHNGRIRLTFREGSRTVERSARRVICTIPFSLLRDIDGISKLGLSPVKLKCIRTLAYGRNSKHMMGFRERMWRKPQGSRPGVNGYVFSDLPSQCFWDTSRGQRGESGIMTNFLGGKAAEDSKILSLDAALTDLDRTFPGVASLYDGNQSLFKWGKYRYSLGSYTCPSPGQYTSIVGSAAEEELEGRLLFAGEHVSVDYQGYMNGAVESANSVADKIIARCLRASG
jgi:monoamine oxidase